MIKSLKLPFWFGVGGKIGEGTQPLPWIHIDDLCQLIKYSIENKQVSGTLNGVAPDIITNGDFTKVKPEKDKTYWLKLNLECNLSLLGFRLCDATANIFHHTRVCLLTIVW